jgi:methionine synthase II (cobalamin-independent)
MSLRVSPPYRAEHLGSLKRPQVLLKKREEFDEKKCSAEELKVVEDEAIRNIVQLQRDAGIKSITDGEFRRCVLVFSKILRAMLKDTVDTCSSKAFLTKWRA